MSPPGKERESAEARTARIAPAEQHPQRTPARWEEDEEYVDLRPYLLTIMERWRTIAAVAIAATSITALAAAFVLPKWYRASTIIRPISTPNVESRMAGLLGGIGGGLSGGLGGIAESLGGGGENDAEEYIAILRGFQFNITLAERHHLLDKLLTPGLLGRLLHASKPKDSKWAAYRALKRRLTCEYSIKTGNITLYFKDKNRSDAEKILGYYIEDLRDLLRGREMRDTSSAIDSLETEAASTPDALLRAQLYELVARQVERKKTAQVEADFAFRVLDPPAASDEPYSPWVLLDSVLAGIFGLIFSAGAVVMKHRTTAESD